MYNKYNFIGYKKKKNKFGLSTHNKTTVVRGYTSTTVCTFTI